MLGTFVKDWFSYESHFVHGRDSLVDILKERGLLSESDAVQPLIDRKSGSAGMPRPISYAVFCLKKKKKKKKQDIQINNRFARHNYNKVVTLITNIMWNLTLA